MTLRGHVQCVSERSGCKKFLIWRQLRLPVRFVIVISSLQCRYISQLSSTPFEGESFGCPWLYWRNFLLASPMHAGLSPLRSRQKQKSLCKTNKRTLSNIFCWKVLGCWRAGNKFWLSYSLNKWRIRYWFSYGLICLLGHCLARFISVSMVYEMCRLWHHARGFSISIV